MKKTVLLMLLVCNAPLLAWGSSDCINMQGIAFDQQGKPLSGDLNVTFKMYAAPEKGTAVWEE